MLSLIAEYKHIVVTPRAAPVAPDGPALDVGAVGLLELRGGGEVIDFATICVISAWVLVINLWAFWVMVFDKWRAKRGGRRVPEAELLLYAFLGGAFGAKLAQKRRRHKTRKQPFAARLNLALVMNVLAAVGLVYLAAPYLG